jgi:NAD-dependent deacetylase
MAEDWQDRLADLNLNRDSYVSVLTGAGVSAESGVPTFRGKDGLWRNYRVEELATPQAFAANPELVWQWYDWRRGIVAAREPNPAHYAITDLENLFERFLLITQNVDGLHRRAGLPERAIMKALEASRASDLMLVVGTSAVVQPAASMPILARQAGAFVVEINPDPTPISPYVDLTLRGKAGEIMPRVVEALRDITS